jgi:methylated-DNA-[protein]-cysteine S-methyltransferase
MPIYRSFSSPLGRLTAGISAGSLTMLHFDSTFPDSPEIDRDDSILLKNLEQQLSEYFTGQRKAFDIPLEPSGTEFQRRVWQELARIPYGATRSYKEQAIALGDLKAIRAVARANGQNPIAILIPCHRVIGEDGSLTGYAGGLERKRKLLQIEGAPLFAPDLFE